MAAHGSGHHGLIYDKSLVDLGGKISSSNRYTQDKLQDVKSKITCGQVGHWTGDLSSRKTSDHASPQQRFWKRPIVCPVLLLYMGKRAVQTEFAPHAQRVHVRDEFQPSKCEHARGDKWHHLQRDQHAGAHDLGGAGRTTSSNPRTRVRPAKITTYFTLKTTSYVTSSA